MLCPLLSKPRTRDHKIPHPPYPLTWRGTCRTHEYTAVHLRGQQSLRLAHISLCIFMCIVGGGNIVLFTIPEIRCKFAVITKRLYRTASYLFSYKIYSQNDWQTRKRDFKISTPSTNTVINVVDSVIRNFCLVGLIKMGTAAFQAKSYNKP